MNLEYEIPKPLVFKIADPLIIYKGNLFQTGQVDETLVNNYFDLNGLRFELDEIETPKRLEDLLFKNHAVEFERIQQQYIQSAIRTEYQSREQINSEIRQNKILHLLITKVLPNITNHNILNSINII